MHIAERWFKFLLTSSYVCKLHSVLQKTVSSFTNLIHSVTHFASYSCSYCWLVTILCL